MVIHLFINFIIYLLIGLYSIPRLNNQICLRSFQSLKYVKPMYIYALSLVYMNYLYTSLHSHLCFIYYYHNSIIYNHLHPWSFMPGIFHLFLYNPLIFELYILFSYYSLHNCAVNRYIYSSSLLCPTLLIPFPSPLDFISS